MTVEELIAELQKHHSRLVVYTDGVHTTRPEIEVVEFIKCNKSDIGYLRIGIEKKGE